MDEQGGFGGLGWDNGCGSGVKDGGSKNENVYLPRETCSRRSRDWRYRARLAGGETGSLRPRNMHYRAKAGAAR